MKICHNRIDCTGGSPPTNPLSAQQPLHDRMQAQKVLVSTITGAMVLEPSARVPVAFGGKDKYVMKLARDLMPWDRVLFDRGQVAVTIDDIEDAIVSESRYKAAFGTLYEAGDKGVTRLRAELVRGLRRMADAAPEAMPPKERIMFELGKIVSFVRNGFRNEERFSLEKGELSFLRSFSEEELGLRISKKDANFTPSEHKQMARTVKRMLDFGHARHGTPTRNEETACEWLRSENTAVHKAVVAPLQFQEVFRALSPVGAFFGAVSDGGSQFEKDYNFIMGIRRGLAKALPSAGGTEEKGAILPYVQRVVDRYLMFVDKDHVLSAVRGVQCGTEQELREKISAGRPRETQGILFHTNPRKAEEMVRSFSFSLKGMDTVYNQLGVLEECLLAAIDKAMRGSPEYAAFGQKPHYSLITKIFMLSISGMDPLERVNNFKSTLSAADNKFFRSAAELVLGEMDSGALDAKLGLRAGSFGDAWARYLTLSAALPAEFWHMKDALTRDKVMSASRSLGISVGDKAVHFTRKDARRAQAEVSKENKKLTIHYFLGGIDKFFVTASLREYATPAVTSMYYEFISDEDFARTLSTHIRDTMGSAKPYSRAEVAEALAEHGLEYMAQFIHPNNFVEPKQEQEKPAQGRPLSELFQGAQLGRCSDGKIHFVVPHK